MLFLTIFTAGRLVGPRIPDDEQKRWCAVNVHVTRLLGVSLNCDSPEFLRLAADPAVILSTSTPFQSRPGMPALAWLISRPLQPLASLVPRLVKTPQRADIEPGRITGALQSFGPEYAAYVLLNLLILCCSFDVFRRIYCRYLPADPPETVAVVAVSFAALMIATYPVTNFLLTPHTQLFNTVVPLLAFFFALRANEGALEDVGFALRVGAIVGFGQTMYANFLVVTMAVLLFAGVSTFRRRTGAASLAFLRNAAVLAALSVAPMVLWYASVRLAEGQFRYHELQDDKSVAWIVISLHQGFAQFWFEFVRRFVFQVAGVVSLLPMILLMATATLGFMLAVTLRGKKDLVVPLVRDLRGMLGVALTVGLVFFAFYVCVGQFQIRLDYAVLPPLVAGGGALATAFAGRLPTRWRRSFGAVCAAIALLALAWGLAEGAHGPARWFD